MAARSDRSFGSIEELLVALQNGQVAGQTAFWLKSNLVLFGAQHDSHDVDTEEEISTVYSQEVEPTIKNFVLVLWNYLFRYPHGVRHINAVTHGLHASGKSANFEYCLRTALKLFAPSSIISDVRAAREVVKWALESTWRSDSRSSEFLHRTEAISSTELLFNRQGAMIGAKFKLQWLNDSAFLVDPFEETSPTFSMIHHFANWVKSSERELDERVVGRNLKRYVSYLCLEEGCEELFHDFMSSLKHFVSKEHFILLLQTISSLLHLQRVRANLDQEENITLFNPDNLTTFATLLGIEIKEFRYQLISDSTRSNATKDPRQVNQDVLRIGVVLYRSLVTWLFDRINEKLAPKDFYAAIELFDVPGVELQTESQVEGYNTFLRHLINDVMTFSAFERRNEERKKLFQREGILLEQDRGQYDEYLSFYFTQGKNESLLSILSQDRMKKDNAKRLAKHIFSNHKTNSRIMKIKTHKTKDILIGIQHSAEDVISYNLERLHNDSCACLSSQLSAAVSESRNPITRSLNDYRNNNLGLNYSRQCLMSFSDRLVTEKSFWMFGLPDHRGGELIERRQINALHLFNQCRTQISDFSESLSHRVIFENYTPIFFTYNIRRQPSPEVTKATLNKLHISAYIGQQNAFISETDFFRLQEAARSYHASISHCQRFARGFLARKLFKERMQIAEQYRKELNNHFFLLRKFDKLFKSAQMDFVDGVTENLDEELIKKQLKNATKTRKEKKGHWGFLYVLRHGKTVAKLELVQDFYWVYANPSNEAQERHFYNLCEIPALKDDAETLCEKLCDGFYFRKSSNDSIAVQRKCIEPMSLWGATKPYRRTASAEIRESEGVLPFKEFAIVFDNERYKKMIAESIVNDKVSSVAIEGECVIPLVTGTLEKHFTLKDVSYCFVIVDLSVRESLCDEKFCKEIREQVKRLKRKESKGDGKQRGKRLKGEMTDNAFVEAASIHSLLIQMDNSLQATGGDEKDLDARCHTRKKREKWSRKAFEKSKLIGQEWNTFR